MLGVKEVRLSLPCEEKFAEVGISEEPLVGSSVVVCSIVELCVFVEYDNAGSELLEAMELLCLSVLRDECVNVEPLLILGEKEDGNVESVSEVADVVEKFSGEVLETLPVVVSCAVVWGMLVETGGTGVHGVDRLDVGGGVIVDKHGFDGVGHGCTDDGPEL